VGRFNRRSLDFLFLTLIALYRCQNLAPHDTASLLAPRFTRSEIFGFVAGPGTTFAAVPDLYYGLLIASRPVIVWNMVAVAINVVSVGAYRHFARKEMSHRASHPGVHRASWG
jgi:MtN3 and saliva related transmembrane protein